MLFIYLILFSTSKKSLYLIPGFTSPALYATITQPKLYPQCPPDLKHFQFFPMNPEFRQKYPKCLGLLFSTFYNSDKNQISPPPEIYIETDSFGNASSFASYSKVVEYLTSAEGYVINETLFGVPYDWVHYYPGTMGLFLELKAHIEMTFNRTNQKVILFGHSMGTHVLRLLFSNFTDSAWALKYVDRVILNAPAFYGCSCLVEQIITGILDDEDTKNDYIAESVRHMPSVFLLFENYNIFKNKSIFLKNSIHDDTTFSEKSNHIYPSEVAAFLNKVGLLDNVSMKIFKLIVPSLFQKPSEMPVKTILFYNSGLPTPVYFNETTLERIEGKGDAVCQSDIIEELCSRWNHTKCIDWKSKERRFEHSPMLSTPEELKMISEFINEKDHDEL